MNGNDATAAEHQSEHPLNLRQQVLLDGIRKIENHAQVYLLPRLISTLNLHKMQAAARQRVCDGHKAQMKLMGADVESCGDGGGISVQGDTVINNTGLKPLVATGLMVAALATGAGVMAMWPMIAGYLPSKTNTPAVVAPAEPAATQPAQAVDSWKLGLRVTDTP